MIAPTSELAERFGSLSPEGRAKALGLLMSARDLIEQLGGTPLVWRDAWEAVLESVESAEGGIR